MSTKTTIVTLATAWGTRFGGINAFNTELVKSLGILPGRDYDVLCIVPGTVPQELIDECTLRFGVGLVTTKGPLAAAEVIRILDATTHPERFLWVGHDDKTGPLALDLKQLAPGSRAVLINHMAHGAYQSIKKGHSAGAVEKTQAQLALFRGADLALAVGPMLHSHLNDLLASELERPPVAMIVPGLAQPAEHGVVLRDTPPENYVAFVGGRLEAEDERIKQGRLAVRAFGAAVRRAGEKPPIARTPTLRMRGVSPGDEEPLRDVLMKEAERAVNFDFQEFTENRGAYLRDLASASAAMMLSWHEGFGLTAWEAIACAVPVVIGKESGVYRLLEEHYGGMGLDHSVIAVSIDGWLPSADEESSHSEADVARVADALLAFAERSPAPKQEAVVLRRNLLNLGLDWKGTAIALTEAVQKHLGVTLTREVAPAPLPQSSAAPPLEPTVPLALAVPPPRQWQRELGLPASMLLTAQDEVVRFDPERQSILDELARWVNGDALLDARLLFGPAGMGKTRLAFQLARDFQRAGLPVVWLPTNPPDDWAESWTKVLRDRGSKRVLFVVDYAESRPSAVLAALERALEEIRAMQSPAPVRLLLLARSAPWLDGLARHSGASHDVAAWLSKTPIEPMLLPPWTRDKPARLTAYRTALEDYAATIGVAVPPNAHVPDLGDPLFNRPLYLHLAALAALEGQRPEVADALLENQMLREWRYWRAVNGEDVAAYDDWADAAAYVALRQESDVDDLSATLKTLGMDGPGIAAAMHRGYPAGDAIAPLEPDLIAEALLRERLGGRRGAALFDAALREEGERRPAAIAVVTRLAADDGGDEAAWRAVLVEGIARHWPKHPQAWLDAAHRAEFGLGEMLAAAWGHLDEAPRSSMAMTLVLPEYSTNLLQLTVAVRRQQLKIAANDASRVGALNNLSGALADRGDPDSRAEALRCLIEAVELCRRLVAGDAAFRPDLAMVLTNLGNRLSAQGSADSHTAAVDAASEAVAIYRELAIGDVAFVSDLAKALNNLSNRLAHQGNSAKALDAARESVDLYRDLYEQDAHGYRVDLASSLHTLSIRLFERGDSASRIESVEAIHEAVQLRRQLADSEPAAHLSDLAASLTNLALRLADVGSALRAEAFDAAEEAVAIYRKLAARQPVAFRPTLAQMLINMNGVLGVRGDAAKDGRALTFVREAVDILRTLVEGERSAYLPDLASSLIGLGVRLFEQNDPDAPAVSREAVDLYRELATNQPAAYRPGLAKALHNLSIVLGSGDEAIERAREAADIRRDLSAADPDAYQADLASSLVNLSRRLFDRGDAAARTEALSCIRHAAQIFARLHREMPNVYEHSLNVAIANLRQQAAQSGLEPDAEVKAAIDSASGA
jgi:tetratricopeptide (TPR) repeat protein/glycosyltransferase involved in cell wall biosynthesis